MSGEAVRVDCHVKVLDEAVVERAKRRGLDALVYAPHFTRLPTIAERAERFSDDELRVLPARELFTGTWRERRHVLAIGLESPVPDFLTLEGAMAELRAQDAAVLVPHPTFLTVSLSAAEIAAHRDVVDAVETANPKHWPHHDSRARRIAERLDCPPFGSSYAHLRGTIGEVWTAFDSADVSIADARSFAASLRDGVPREVQRRRGVTHQARCALEFAHLGYENSWKKVDRVLLGGTEPTHPDQPAYEGRFDDVAAY